MCVLAFQCIYGKPGDSLFTNSTYAAVLHHNQSPEFYDEVRLHHLHLDLIHHVIDTELNIKRK